MWTDAQVLQLDHALRRPRSRWLHIIDAARNLIGRDTELMEGPSTV